ncbi:MAG TPA: hypothetical protein PLS39_00915 [Accumulibacter sp.]|nr:hypothetical protein [Accumulibacter sp.]HND78991.1 hypothetical protein [Accumulibacter sp.]HNJ99500.1 hypothetical protein [Accumulibacter sp.]HNL12685.1 hypothetical protein [Accumulibacter sp.]
MSAQISSISVICRFVDGQRSSNETATRDASALPDMLRRTTRLPVRALQPLLIAAHTSLPPMIFKGVSYVTQADRIF